MFKKFIIGFMCLAFCHSISYAMTTSLLSKDKQKAQHKAKIANQQYSKNRKKAFNGDTIKLPSIVRVGYIKDLIAQINNGEVTDVEMLSLDTFQEQVTNSPLKSALKTALVDAFNNDLLSALVGKNLITSDRAKALSIKKTKATKTGHYHSPTKGSSEEEAVKTNLKPLVLFEDNEQCSTTEIQENSACGVADLSTYFAREAQIAEVYLDYQYQPSNTTRDEVNNSDNLSGDENFSMQDQYLLVDEPSNNSSTAAYYKGKIDNRRAYKAWLSHAKLVNQGPKKDEGVVQDEQSNSNETDNVPVETPKRTKKTTHISSRMPRIAKVFGAGILAAGIGYFTHYYFTQQKRTKKK